jgi:serine/threonine-protein kinase
MAISKDGGFIVYWALNDAAESVVSWKLFLRELGNLDAEPIPGTEGGIGPFLSPDNRWIGFWRDKKLWKVPIEGGVPQELCEALMLLGASWGDDDSIVFAGDVDTGLCEVRSQGGEPEILTEPDPEKKEYSHRLPFHLPNGKGVLFTIMRNGFDLEPRIAILERDIGKWRMVLEDASDARYVPTGHLVFLRRGNLMAAAFDRQKLEVSGQPIPIIPGVMHNLNSGLNLYNVASGQYDISDSGSLVYVPGSIAPNQENLLVWVDQKGNEEPISPQSKAYFSPRLSPDGHKIVYFTRGTEWYIWIYDISRDIHSQVVTERIPLYPIWTPDGNRIVFSWSDSGPANIYMAPADGSRAMERITTSENPQSVASFSPDGNLLAYLEHIVESGENRDILIYDFRDKSITPFAATEHYEYYPEFSPDGRWIVYVSHEEGQGEVYVRSSSGIGEKIKISRDGGVEPLWARSGKQLFYRWGSQMWAVDIQTEPNFSPGSPRLLFEKEGLSTSRPVRGYDISLDDRRFLMVRRGKIEPQPEPVTDMILIQNWFEEIKRRVPKGK